MKSKKAFTLIELLVVIAIIALLLSVVVPSLRMAKEYAKKIICQSNIKQIGVAIGTYEAQYNFNFRTNDKWYPENGTGDLPYEINQSKWQRDLMAARMLPDYQVFFCPTVRNVSYSRNYIRGNLAAGQQDTGHIMHLRETDSSIRPVFWTTYIWLWNKGKFQNMPASNIQSNNNTSNDVLLTDVPNTFWELALNIGNSDSTMLSSIFGSSGETVQLIPHGNALMKDLSVVNPTDDNLEFTRWLWNSDRWAGINY